MHLSDIYPLEIALETILFYLNQDDHKKLRCTHKPAEAFYTALNSSHHWAFFLTAKYRKTSMTSLAAKKCFIDKPNSRSNYVLYDIEGAQLTTDNILREMSKLGYKTKNKARIAKLIYQGAVTKTLLESFQRHQLDALSLKISIDIITSPNFTKIHFAAMRNFNFTYDKIKGLNKTQVRGLCSGFTYQNVNAPWFTSSHIRAIDKGIERKDILGKNDSKINIILEKLRTAKSASPASP